MCGVFYSFSCFMTRIAHCHKTPWTTQNVFSCVTCNIDGVSQTP